MDLAEGTHKLRSTIFCLYDCRLNNNNCPVNVVDIQIILIFFHIRVTELSNRAKCLFFDLTIHHTSFAIFIHKENIKVSKFQICDLMSEECRR